MIKEWRRRFEVGFKILLGPGCREFESRHSDQISRNGFMPFLLISFGEETRKIKCDCPVDSRFPTVRAAATPLFSSLREENVNESRHSTFHSMFATLKNLEFPLLRFFFHSVTIIL